MELPRDTVIKAEFVMELRGEVREHTSYLLFIERVTFYSGIIIEEIKLLWD